MVSTTVDDENGEPSLDEMAIDDSLPMLVRLKKYAVSNLFLHRHVSIASLPVYVMTQRGSLAQWEQP